LVHPVWSATSCDFPGAGLYIGLAPIVELHLVSRLLAPKRLRTTSGGTTRFGQDGSVCPMVYCAVRDPSVVRVIPVKRPPLPNGYRHVKLSFQLAGLKVDETLDELRQIAGGSTAMDGTGTFVMTIGLPIAEEPAFHQRLVGGGEPIQDFADLYTRLCDTRGPDK
jgi:hypothetical protein